ncbi:hypothetical protein OHB54_44520 [Streptomyces sp. NBC_01007]|nr:hypothetical protein OHB54_44520 [Streptomyces sp. NBC_01007]
MDEFIRAVSAGHTAGGWAGRSIEMDPLSGRLIVNDAGYDVPRLA